MEKVLPKSPQSAAQIEAFTQVMNSERMFLALFSLRPFHPDRVRSFLQLLQKFEGPFALRGLPANLYLASEKLVAGSSPLDPRPWIERADRRDHSATIKIEDSFGWKLFSIDFGPAVEAGGYFGDLKFLDLLVTGARMMSADCAAVSLEPEPNFTARLRMEDGKLKLHAMPLALWISGPLTHTFAVTEPGHILQEEWDGSMLLLHSSTVDAQNQRQEVRWLIHQEVKPGEEVTKVFRGALTSPDWEVRVSAMLGAARLGISSLGLDVRRMQLPQSRRQGVGPEDRRMLRELQKAAWLLLAGETSPSTELESRSTRDGMRAHLLRCILGLPVNFYDDLFLLVHALTEPLPAHLPQPDKLPAGVEAVQEGKFRTIKSGIELVWIPPVVHWLGQGESIRQLPSAGFFLSKWPVQVSSSGECYSCPWEQARIICNELSVQEGVRFDLPSADEWEMGARGPDGRRLPWGNGLQPEIQNILSPWGMGVSPGMIGQWTSDGWICGSPEDPRCASRKANGTLAGARLKIALQKEHSGDASQ